MQTEWKQTIAQELPERFVLVGATIASADGQPGGPLDLRIREHAALVVEHGRLAWLGAADDLPEDHLHWARFDLAGRLVTPQLIDCHTHLVYAGDRAEEFRLRLEGASYEEIAERGGGIVSTVRATRDATEDELLVQADRRLRHLLREGVRTVEIKSGYGLEAGTELRMLRTARRLEDRYRPIGLRVIKTFLAAHTVPPEYRERRGEYLRRVCDEWLPSAYEQGLVDAVDVFCETVAFNLEETAQVLAAAGELDLPVRVHAEQLSSSGAAALAASHGAASADHLEYLDAFGAQALSRAGTVAVLLPGAFYSLRETRRPPIDALRDAMVPMALATDWNPGTSPLGSLLLAMNLGCTLFRLTPAEALLGVTAHAARALGCWPERGTLTVGGAADLLVWNLRRPEELSYRIAGHEAPQVIVRGKVRNLPESMA